MYTNFHFDAGLKNVKISDTKGLHILTGHCLAAIVPHQTVKKDKHVYLFVAERSTRSQQTEYVMIEFVDSLAGKYFISQSLKKLEKLCANAQFEEFLVNVAFKNWADANSMLRTASCDPHTYRQKTEQANKYGFAVAEIFFPEMPTCQFDQVKAGILNNFTSR